MLDRKNITSAHILTLATDSIETLLFITSAPSNIIELLFLKDKHGEECLEFQMARQKEIHNKIQFNIAQMMLKNFQKNKL